jgi:hypothetical protein
MFFGFPRALCLEIGIKMKLDANHSFAANPATTVRGHAGYLSRRFADKNRLAKYKERKIRGLEINALEIDFFAIFDFFTASEVRRSATVHK